MADTVAQMRKWLSDPVAWTKDVLDMELDSWQVEVARAFVTNPRVAMKACKGPGKSYLMAVLTWWYMMTHPRAIGCAVSITGDNLRDGLWTELQRLRLRSPLLQQVFEWQKTRIFAKESPDDWWITARTFDKTANDDAQSNTLAGLHNEQHGNAVLIVLDEAGDMPRGLVAAADAIMANSGDARILMAGNPTSTSGALYHSCVTQRDHWHVTSITSDPDDPMRTPRVSEQWARDTIDMWGGRDSPYVQVNILGQFPSKNFNTLFSLAKVEHALGRHKPEHEYRHAPKIVGIDIAGEGDDTTVAVTRQGSAIYNCAKIKGTQEPDAVGAQLITYIRKVSPDLITIDNTGGWGGAVRVMLKSAGIACVPVGFAEKANDDKQFYNRRAEMYWLFSRWLMDESGVLPNETELIAELTEPTYSYKGDRIILEPKEKIKERIGRSPDIADACALTFAVPTPALGSEMKGNNRRPQFANSGKKYRPLAGR